jgi:hypothetical protein
MHHFRIPAVLLRASLGILFIFAHCPLFAQQNTNATATQRQTYELRFLSQKRYSNPHSGITLWCSFRRDDSTTIRIGAFWDGDMVQSGDTLASYKVRFAAPHTGTWTWTTTCTDSTNTRLHGQRGSVNVLPYNGTNPLYERGFMRVAPNKRTLVYGDGSPFFYLGDTAWEITWRSTMDEVKRYISTRKQQGFNAVQIVAMTHIGLWEFGTINRQNQTYFLNRDFFMINPRYFDYLDSIVQMLNDSGMVAVLVPAWANGMTEANHVPAWYPKFLPNDAVLLMAKYTAARYAGNHVVWIVGGDAPYSLPSQQKFWGQFAETIQQMDGKQHLTTVHSKGFSGSYEFFPNPTPWLDFHTYQSSHIIASAAPRAYALQGFVLSPPKPILNAEPIYEDIISNFWSNPSPVEYASAEDVRNASYSSVLSGSLVGCSYGAHGIWQWNSAAFPADNIQPRLNVDSALTLPGARHMAIMKNIMENYVWHRLEPAQSLVRTVQPSSIVMDAAQHSNAILAYFPRGIASATLNASTLTGRKYFRWHNPATGVFTSFRELSSADGMLSATPPTQMQDWLLAVSNDTNQIGRTFITSVRETPSFQIVQNFSVYPNPIGAENICTVDFIGTETGVVEITLTSLMGEVQSTGKFSLPAGARFQHSLNMSVLPPGVYALRVVNAASRTVIGSRMLLRL